MCWRWHSDLQKYIKTLQENKAVLLGLATEGSPDSVYKALESDLKQGSVSLANVLATGHEEAWGSYEPRSKSDFDYFRTNLLEGLGLKINPMVTPAEFSAENLGGNFIPMHLDDDPSQAMTAFGEIFR
jgi:6-phosphogluconolactonase/glucosamine-6-phosphate isomerase/deaminase